ncbi:MAG: DUF2085 domain-containing protein [Ignavibacteria bacterium]|nr:DUF2085 domain-containing protein [Ignavibacteria bacterium]
MLNIPECPDVNIGFARRIYRLILFICFVWIALIVLPPVLANSGGVFATVSDYMYIAFSPICHQEEARSFYIADNPLGVCSRCTMIYAGFAFGVLIYPLFRRISDVNPPSLWFLLIPLAMIGTDVLLDRAGVVSNTFLTRSFTGFLTGASLAFFIIPGFIRFFYEITAYLRQKERVRD